MTHIFLFQFVIPFISSTIVCPPDTYFLSNQAVTFETSNFNWSYFAVDVSNHVPFKLKIKVNETSYLYKGKGLYCPNHSWFPSFKKLKAWRDTTISISPSIFQTMNNHRTTFVQTFGIFTYNSTLISIRILEPIQYNFKITSTCILSILLITMTIIIFTKYVLSKHNS